MNFKTRHFSEPTELLIYANFFNLHPHFLSPNLLFYYFISPFLHHTSPQTPPSTFPFFQLLSIHFSLNFLCSQLISLINLLFIPLYFHNEIESSQTKLISCFPNSSLSQTQTLDKGGTALFAIPSLPRRPLRHSHTAAPPSPSFPSRRVSPQRRARRNIPVRRLQRHFHPASVVDSISLNILVRRPLWRQFFFFGFG